MQIKPTTKELLYILGTLFSLGATWGALSSKVNAQEEVVKTVPGIATRVAVVEAKQDYTIGLLEYALGLRHALPSRPRPLSQ